MAFHLASVKNAHCIGIKGIGLSALAQILAAQGCRVTGSDVPDPFPADTALKRARIHVFRGFARRHVSKNCDLVIVSNAYLQAVGGQSPHTLGDNVEVRTAARLGIPVVPYPVAVAELFNAGTGIAVSGSHGKSTTSALLGVTLEKLDYDPAVITGAVVKNWASNARPTQINTNRKAKRNERCCVLEADEYRNAFLHYKPFGAIITSVDWDHPDFFPTPSSYHVAFAKFVRRIDPKGFLVLNGDDLATRALARKTSARRIITYGGNVENTLRIHSVVQTPNGLTFSAFFRKKPIGRFDVMLFGRHHASNTAAVIAACLALGTKPSRIRMALAQFQGTKRRFEVLAPIAELRRTTQKRIRENPRMDPRESAIVIDDYAHHPTEIRATIEAARETFPGRRIRVIFQPHTFSRTKTFFQEFVGALKTADEATLLKTYGSARERSGSKGGRSEDLAKALGARHFATHKNAIAYFRATLQPNDVFITMGAGDGDQIARNLT